VKIRDGCLVWVTQAESVQALDTRSKKATLFADSRFEQSGPVTLRK